MMFRNQKLQRAIAAVVLTTFTSLTLYPLTAAAQVKDTLENAGLLPKIPERGIVDDIKHYLTTMAGTATSSGMAPEERFAQLLGEIHEDLKAAAPEAALSQEAKRFAKGKYVKADPAGKAKGIRAKRRALQSLYADMEQGFQKTAEELKVKKLPQAILDRQAEAVAQFAARRAEFEKLMDKLDAADDANDAAGRQAALDGLGAFMAKYPNAKRHQYTDPNKLPFRTPDGKARKPYETKADYQANLFPPKYEKVQLASLSLNGVQLAQATLPQVPDGQDLAETDDVQITPAITAKANELHKNPVEIYNWVRNNVEFIPSYGSIQGADMTLANQRGNAFDTASLLIALYRASGIPARYVYGTIEVPADKVMNWVGGVTKPEAAQSLLGQGGIPNVALVSGGTVKAIRMEHVWVEAYVDYSPSRGAMNKTPASWVPMDASFKQYQYTSGMDIKANVPLDSQALLNSLQQGATVDTAQGYAQNLNTANLQSQLAAYQQQVQNYVNSQKANATVSDVLGSQKVIERADSILLGSLPYRTVAVGNKFQSLPDNLKWKFKTNLYAADGISTGDDPIIELNQSTARLAGKKITLSFVPATQADQDLINSYLPKPHADGTPIQPGELPTSLPGYLLKMKAEFRIDGNIVAQTNASFTMGSDVRQSNQYFDPATGAWEGGDDNDIVVGEYNAIGLDLQGIGVQQLTSFQSKVEMTSNKLGQFQQTPSNTALIDGLSKEELIGDILQSGILSYFAQVDSSDSFMAKTSDNVITYRLPSYGRFFSVAKPYLWFGVVRNVTFPGVIVDVDYLKQHTEAKNVDQGARINFTKLAGALGSAAESTIPEGIFKNPNLPASDSSQPQGVSAVKALAIAAIQGQRVYTLNQSNEAAHSAIVQSLQIDEDVKAEIVEALVSGKEVTVHDKNINVNGWVGCGYTIIDPTTGAGAYKIAGGANGGQLQKIIHFLLYFIVAVEAKLTLNAILLGVSEEVREAIGNIAFIFRFLVDLIDIWTSCSGEALTAGILLYTAAAIIGLAMLTLITGGIASFIAFVIFSKTLDYIKDGLKESRCRHG
jgi:hypothetical protein